MKVEVEDVSAIEKKVKVEIAAEQVRDEFELAFSEVQKEARVKGFRPGKAPRKILERHFNDYIRERVLRKLLEETIGPALDRKQLKPIIEPAVDLGELKPDQPFSYTLKVELKPAVELKQYQGFEIEQEIFELTEKSIEHELENMRERYALYQDPKEPRPAQESDLLVLDLKAELDGKPFPPASGDNLQYTMGQETYLPGFARELAGIRVGESRTFKLKHPEDSPRKELAGKELTYTVALKSLKEKILPELNDDFAKEFGGQENLVELRKKVGGDMASYLKRLSRLKMERVLLDKLVEQNPVEAPKGVVRRHSRELAESSLRRRGVKEPSEEELGRFSSQFAERAEKEVKAGFILEAVIAKENLQLGKEDEERRLKELAGIYQVDPSKLKDQLGEDQLKHFRAQWLEDQALDFLLSQSKIKDKRVSSEEMPSPGEEVEAKT